MKHSSLKLRILIISFIAILLSMMVTPVRAQALVDYDDGTPGHGNGHRSGAADGLQVVAGVAGGFITYTVTIQAGTPIGLPVPAAGANILIHLSGDFPPPNPPARPLGWSFTPAAAGLAGELRVIFYDAALYNSATGQYGRVGAGGAAVIYANYFEVQYVAPAGGLALPLGHRLQWIQYLTTNWPTSGPDGTGPADPAGGNYPHGTVLPLPNLVSYIDPYDYNHGTSDSRPFYLTEAERAAETVLNAAGNVLSFTFTDAPWRSLSRANPPNPAVTWTADLYLVEWDGNDPLNPLPGRDPANANVIIYTGVRWGFTITAAAGGGAAGPGAWNGGGVAGDKFDGDEGGMLVNGTLVSGGVGGVGGIVIPVDKLALLAPYIGLTSTIVVAAVVSVVYVKRVKRRKEKQ